MKNYKFGYPIKSSGIKLSVELIGVISGIIGSFAVANAIPTIGYPLFTLSSILLVFTAFKQNNFNLVMLQGVFLLANINGLITFLK
jgi:hypothetical protein